MVKKLSEDDLNQMTFKVGDVVAKQGGDYTFCGVIVAAFWKVSGAHRYVVENGSGILHIFSEKNLKKTGQQQ